MNETEIGPSLQIRLLGRFQVVADDRVVEEADWQRRYAKQLVKLLALSPQNQLHREQVMESLWPERSPTITTNSLNKAIHMARRALEPSLTSGTQSQFLLRVSDLILLRATGGLSIDVDVFEEHAAQAIKAGNIDKCESALADYSGDLLDEDPYENWLLSKRDALRVRRNELMIKLAELCESEGYYQESIERLNALVEHEPTHEDAHQRLMRLYASTGHRRKAILQYQRCCEEMKRGLDAQPEKSTSELHELILSGRFQPSELTRKPLQTDHNLAADSVAVLPFTNIDGAADLEYLCDGITESLIHDLARLPELRVMARSTVFQYKGRDVNPQIVGRELQVRAVVMGRVAQRNDQLTIGTELVNGTDGSLLWGQQYNRTLTDIFSIQEEISSEIARTLKPKLTSIQQQLLYKRHTESTEAYHSYLKGRFYWNKRTGDGLRRALDYFWAAIEEDPDYALAYTGLADSYNVMSLFGIAPPKETMPKARAAAGKALEIDETLAQAHTSLAYCKLSYEWDWRGAEKCFRTAIKLNPNYATAYQWFHKQLTAMGRFAERTEQINKAKDFDPLSLIINTEEGWGLYHSRQYDHAIDRLLKTLEMDPHFALARLLLGLAYQQQQRFDEAVTEIQSAIALRDDNPFTLAIGVLGHTYAKAGEPELAQQQLTKLAEISQQTFVPAYCFALVHAGLDDDKEALAALKTAFEERYDRMIFLNVEPMFDSLRSHPGFRQLINRLALN